MKPEIVIDGDRFHDFPGFAKHFSEIALKNQHCWRGNLDAFNDILRGGFGTPDGGFSLIWRNHKKSQQDLGQSFNTLLEIIQNHGPGGLEAEDRVALTLE
jgi:RNAse (barnase) inhibitor barstar